MDSTNTNFNLTEGMGIPHTAQQENPLPRAVLRPNTHYLLDGEWSFAVDPDDRGLREQWYLGHKYQHTAHWPGSVEAHMAKAKGEQQAPAWRDKVIAWYEREFPRPEKSSKSSPSMFQITFGACGYETRVWLNGRLLSTIEGEEVHYGEYTSFSYELNEEHLLPVNHLTVRIADTMSAEIPRGKQESHVYKRGGIWYQTYTGAVRSVWLETVERNRLRTRVGVNSIIEDSLVRFNVTTRIHDPGQYTLRLKVYERDGEQAEPLAVSDFSLRLQAGQKQQYVVMKVPDGVQWSPENPHLYRLVAQLIDATGYTAEIEAHFGLRKFEARGRHLFLNNKEIYIDGILYQPGTATYEEMRQHMYAMKELGCNLVRVHIAGVDPRIYNLADEIGMLLWVEVPSTHSSTTQSRENHKAELMRMLALIETNPSVVIWSLYNEDWGAQDIATNPDTRQYIMDMFHYMKIRHPQFLVVDNDGWQHISYEGKLKSDILTAHLYTPELERWKELLDQLTAGQMEGVAAFPLVVGDPYFYRGQSPLIVSEWGGFGFSDYGGPQNLEDRAERIQQFKEELRKRPIAGDVYTQATNIEDERNGLIDTHTGELSVPAGLLSSR
ncbi:glycosyl hydrolase family 2 [Pontibacter ummariensis]|uniref:Glycosyl hydrolases family 2, sugar binding domain n=1 Tax=Pontibacter ummariensis TaxID=1610492 RepID=A0A239FGB4_9BACT|nr:glycoside hydrolase family 2 TIM barrel-domain containing protein [Pontibacter ummariensis]PRY12290.1 glycosyl hydrolase family 2 [Pontibacter ummariensis]SNS55333.1 Glycosyl hydrolases family 2, sugar binding domain [Pontibacter ummariensis]